MPDQIYYEDIAVGSEIPSLVKQPTPRQLVRWAGASGDYTEIHYNSDAALKMGLSGIIAQGQLVYCFLGQLLTDWVGEKGSLRKLSCSYRGMNFPGQAIVCRGKVTKKYLDAGEHCLDCNVWTENPEGKKTITGTATVILPSWD